MWGVYPREFPAEIVGPRRIFGEHDHEVPYHVPTRNWE